MVRRIAAGHRNSVFGITYDGRLLTAGTNLTHGPRGNLSDRIKDISGVVDVFAAGSEGERIYIAE